MDQYTPMPSNTPVNQGSNRPQGEAFLKIGPFELVFVTIVLLLLFGALNYFNILPVSKVFPNQLGWLPHQTQQKTIIPSPTNYTPATFQYDTKKAEKLLMQYIKDTIKPEFLPAKIEVKQGLSIDNRLEASNYRQFGIYYDMKTSTISANFHFKENQNTANDYSVFIQPSNVNQTTATVSLTRTILSSYLVNPYIVSDCQTKGTSSYCENFQIINEGKKGYGLIILNNRPEQAVVFNCFVPKESKDYLTQDSCIKLP